MSHLDALIVLRRQTGVFTSDPGLVEMLARQSTSLQLAPDQLLHPEPHSEYLVRLGRLRVSQFLPDGREITRAVLQAGGHLAVISPSEDGDNPADDLYSLPDLVLMAMGETELWQLPLGSLQSET